MKSDVEKAIAKAVEEILYSWDNWQKQSLECGAGVENNINYHLWRVVKEAVETGVQIGAKANGK